MPVAIHGDAEAGMVGEGLHGFGRKVSFDPA